MSISKGFFSRRRRGMTSITETVICTMLFAMILVVLLRMLAYSNEWTLRTQEKMDKRLDVDFLVDVMTEDMKSATNVELIDDKLQIVSDTRVTVYARYNYTIYRDTEEVISDVIASSFTPIDGDSVRVYIQTDDGDIIDLTIHR